MIEYEPFKPLNKRSKFLKSNKDGQVPCDCVYFNFAGKHCFDDIGCDCKVLKGEYCDKYRGSKQ